MAAGYFPSREELQSLGVQQETLHGRARAAARERFHKDVFVRGVVEISNFCRENCSYCGMRRENRGLDRFRADPEALAELILTQRPQSITDLNIQAGEDTAGVRKVAVPLIRMLKRETSLGISVCLGTLDEDLYGELQAAGATIYIIKFEIADAAFYQRMAAPGRLSERVEHIKKLARAGWVVSSGFISGLPGQTIDMIEMNFALAAALPLSGCSVSPFVPGDETPLKSSAGAGIDLTLNCMAGLRLMRPDWVIPAVSALNLADPADGYGRGLRTGANLVTMNLTPAPIRDDYLLYKRDRFIMTEERILKAIAREGLNPSSQSLASYVAGTQSGSLVTRADE